MAKDPEPISSRKIQSSSFVPSLGRTAMLPLREAMMALRRAAGRLCLKLFLGDALGYRWIWGRGLVLSG